MNRRASLLILQVELQHFRQSFLPLRCRGLRAGAVFIQHIQLPCGAVLAVPCAALNDFQVFIGQFFVDIEEAQSLMRLVEQVIEDEVGHVDAPQRRPRHRRADAVPGAGVEIAPRIVEGQA